MSANYQTLPPPPPAGSKLASPPPTGRGTKIFIGCLVGGAIIFVLVLGGALVAGGIFFANNFKVGSAVQVPSDFPIYPHARQNAAFTIGARDHDPAHSVSLVQWDAPARPGPVSDFYAAHLNIGDWEVLDQNSLRIVFRRRSTGNVGTVTLRDQLIHTLIQLQMTGNQPLDPGAPYSSPPSDGSTTN
ncbi:MAG TPA: hypothetical protein VNV65_08040 [Candidatus Solibacter sp.]|nr:hypothetical protein [Candidatus Solibacter sp.]